MESKCGVCLNGNAIVELQHAAVCERCFLSHFEARVFRTIREFGLIVPGDHLCIAASGGKDSLALLDVCSRFAHKVAHPRASISMVALAVDEGIHGYREHTLADLRRFCGERGIELKVVSYKEEFGKSLDGIMQRLREHGSKAKPCAPCGVLRRYLLNRHARLLGATKLVTGHNLDDEAQAFLMNLFKASSSMLPLGGPKSGIAGSQKFVPRVKPLFLTPEKETRLYALLRGFDISFNECPNADDGFRTRLRSLLNDFECHHPGTKHALIRSYLTMLPALREYHVGERRPLRSCELCDEPSANEVCSACRVVMSVMDEDVGLAGVDTQSPAGAALSR